MKTNKIMEKQESKNVPKKDGSGKGKGANEGRSGCNPPKRTRQGENK